MLRRRVLCLLLLSWLAAPGPVRADRTDDYVKAEMARQKITGLSLVVLKDGKTIKVAGYGLADVKAGTPAAPETVYKIGSVSKQFIATGIMLLAQEGKLRVDDPVGKYIDGTPDTWSAITVRKLLTHTAGLVREAPAFAPFKVQPDIDVIRSAFPVDLRTTPGTKWEYSNTGYFTLAEIISRVSGKPWTEYLHDKVFAPTGMLATWPTNTTQALPHRAVGYTDNDNPREAPNWPALRPSGAFLSTVLDLAKWDVLLGTDKVLKTETRQQMWTPVTLNDGTTHPYGFGWGLEPLKDHKRVRHGGSLPGFISEYARFPDDRLTVVVLMNMDDADVRGLAEAVALLYLEKEAAATAAGR